MSGVYIRGLEMPKERDSFQITIKYNGLVFDTETGMQIAEAHEVPDHGRLIDADALVEECMKEDSFIAEMLFRKVSNAPTIIPADRED